MRRSRAFFAESITAKITACIAGILLFGVVTFVVAFALFNAQKVAGTVINEAGRLRMLSQQMAKAALMVVSGHETARYELHAAAALFDSGLNSIWYGDTEMGIPPAPAGLVPQVENVEQHWKPFYASVERLARVNEADSVLYGEATAAISAGSLALLAEADNAVTLFEEEARAKITRLFIVFLAILGFDVIMAVVGLMGARRSIKRVVALAAAVDRATSGNWGVEVEAQTTDEVGQLARSFNAMMRDFARASAALQESETTFRAMFQGAAIGIARVSIEGKPLEVNPALERMLGYTSEELRLMVFTEVTHPDDALVDLELYRELISGRRDYYTMEKRYIRKEGTLVWAHLTVSLVRNIEGIPQFAIGMVEDITERRQAEEALRESEARYRRFVDHNPDAIIVHQEGRIRYVNPAGVALCEAGSSEALIGRSLLDIVHPDYREIARARARRIVDSQVRPEVELQFLRLDGKPVDVEVKGIAIAYEGKPAWLIVVRDITARKQAAEQREALIEELEAKNAELERFTYTVSHDLKSPLVTIKGFLGLLEQDAVAGHTERVKADIARISRAADTMHQLLGDLLELSRIGRLMNPPEPVSLSALAYEAAHQVAGLIMARGVLVEIDRGLPVTLGDRVRLLEVMQNLIENAVRYMGDQAAPCVEVGFRQEGTEAVCYVRDNGIGIAPEYHEKVFGLFERLDAGTEGTGIGLALVKRIVEVHGGRIWVESKGEGHGSTFWFTLPQNGTSAQYEYSGNTRRV